jgi:hypothetical protein
MHRLKRHPASAGGETLALEAEAALAGSTLRLEFRVAGAVDAVLWPEPACVERTDGLWRTTCFEAFLTADEGYREFNISPSGRWSAYQFSGYREGMADLPAPAPTIVVRRGVEEVRIEAELHVGGSPGPVRLSLSAVIEDLAGGRSYWALAHPADKPDFHHPDSFVLKLSPA